MTAGRVLAACLVAAFGLIAPAQAEAPRRVVSMNLCTDQLAMLIAAPGQLVSISHLARDPRSSSMAEEARAYPVNHGLAEEVFLLHPDLVVTGTYTPHSTVQMLERLGVRVVEIAPARALADIRDRLAQMGRALGREAVAAGLVTRFDADLAAARRPAARRLRAATFFENGYTSGAGTLASSVLDAAGLANISVELGYRGGGRLPLELLVMARPDLIVTGRDFGAPARAQDGMIHPALSNLRSRAGGILAADADWICGTPFIAAAVRRLAAARDAVLGGR